MKLSAKINTRNNIIQKLCSTTWGASATVLRSSAISLVYSAAEYGAPVWLNSCHVSKLDTQLNSTMRTITGCIKSTPTHWLPTLCHIPPPELRRQQALLREYEKLLENPLLPIHGDIRDASLTRLRSRQPTVKLASILHESGFDIARKWEDKWVTLTPPTTHNHISTALKPPGFDLHRKVWKTANRIRTGHGLCADQLHKWGSLASPECPCGADRQTIAHITLECAQTAYPGNPQDLITLTPGAIEWIENLNINI